MSDRRTHTPTLFRRFDGLAGRIPWTPLGTLPTPVERLSVEGGSGGNESHGDESRGDESREDETRDGGDGAGGHRGVGAGRAGDAGRAGGRFGTSGELWVKRDDLTGAIYGGNKVRKLEFLLAAAADSGAGRVVTGGAIGSHHALATTIYGRRLGMESTLVLFPQPVTPHVRDVLRLHHAFGAELRFSPVMIRLPLDMKLARFAHRDASAVVIPPGGSNEVGALGYVDAGLELVEQIERGEAPAPDAVYAAAGTLGTVVGLAIGFVLGGLETRVVGVRVTSRLVVHGLALRSLVRRTLRRLADVGVHTPALGDVIARIELRHGRIGRGYGHPTDDGRRARERLEAAGLRLDPTYTAKVAAELLEAAEADGPGVRLFWHTLSAALPVERAESVDATDLPPPFRRFLAS